jgi:hypothetical protein
MRNQQQKFFIKRPHAVEQFRERAKLSKRQYSFERAEQCLREALEDAEMQGLFAESRKEGEFVARVAIPGCEVVYALIEPGASDGKYEFLVTTVFDQDMYHAWNKDNKLGTVGEVEKNEKALQAIVEDVEHTSKPRLWVRWKNGSGQMTELKEFVADNVGAHIIELLHKGVKLSDIEVYKQVEWVNALNIGELT